MLIITFIESIKKETKPMTPIPCLADDERITP
jgi:hypothetical protein